MEVNSNIEFNTILFEKRLSGLKDSQESINGCGKWCLQNRHHHKRIVSCWLNVLKRVKLDQRVTLFHLANDVIQYSKRRNYDFVESWGTTLQKATTLVRDEKVKNKILRIFKIWGERGIYDDEFLADLCGLISASPTIRKGDETHEFQPAYLIKKITACANLETDTDTKLKLLKEHNPKIQIESDSLITSLKDRAHVDDVEKELEDYGKHMEDYVSALKLEIKSRIHLVSLLSQADQQLENDKKDVHVVTNAYKTFASRVKNLKKKLDEKIPTLGSPVPSPDVNAPSPSLDSDEASNNAINSPKNSNSMSDPASLYTNPGYYNPVPAPATDFISNNNFTSFMGSNLTFNLQKLGGPMFENSNNGNLGQTQRSNLSDKISELFPSMSCPPPPPEAATNNENYQYNRSNSHVPLMPPPMPPFNKTGDGYYGDTYNGSNNSNYSTPYENYDQPTVPPYQPSTPQSFPEPTPVPTFNSYVPSLNTITTSSFPPSNISYPEPTPSLTTPYSTAEEYNPEEDVETWDAEPTWEQPPIELETPESPPIFEKLAYDEPIEYHDSNVYNNAGDVDQRVLHINDAKIGHRNKDVDHRNLISLTGSPNEGKEKALWPNQGDQDYRLPMNPEVKHSDQDYRVPLNIENFKLPPPPPPPKMLANQNLDPNFGNHNLPTFDNHQKNAIKRHGISPKKLQDNNESIDMDLSDDEQALDGQIKMDQNNDFMEMPPPFPNLDDLDANEFLDNVSQELDMMSGFESNESEANLARAGLLGHGRSFPPNFGNPSNVGSAMLPQFQVEWIGNSGFNQEFQTRELFRGRGGNMRGKFNNRGLQQRGHRGAWGGSQNDFRGRGRSRANRNGGEMRGNRGNRGFGGRGDVRIGKDWRDFRGRGTFRGNNFRGNF